MLADNYTDESFFVVIFMVPKFRSHQKSMVMCEGGRSKWLEMGGQISKWTVENSNVF